MTIYICDAHNWRSEVRGCPTCPRPKLDLDWLVKYLGVAIDNQHTYGDKCSCSWCKMVRMSNQEKTELRERLEALERVAQAVRDWQAVDDLVLELEMYALERTKHELLIIEALKALDNYTSSGIESGETK